MGTALARYADLLSFPKKVNFCRSILLHSICIFFWIFVLMLIFFNLLMQSALIALASHASDPKDAERLRHLASPAGKVGF